MKNILAYRFSAMGDVAMTVPVLRAVTEQNPGVQITMASRSFFKPFFDEIPQVNFIGIDLNHYKGLPGLYKLYRELKSTQPDAVADLHDVLRTKVLDIFFKTSGFTVSVIDKGRADKKQLTKYPHKILKPLLSTHERYADVFRRLGLQVDLSKAKLYPPEVSQQVKLFLKITGNKKLLGIAPFAAHEGKQFPLKKIKEVIEILLKENPDIQIFLFGGGKKEKLKLDELESIDRNSIVNVAGMFPFKEELQLIGQLDLMLSMDSGNGHLAAMYGVPVITIWGATHPYAGFMPFGQPGTNQILPDLQQFPQLPTSVYGQKTFPGFEKVWESIPVQSITGKISNLLNRQV